MKKKSWEDVPGNMQRIEVPGGWIYSDIEGPLVFVPKPPGNVSRLEAIIRAARLAQTALEFVVADGDQDLFHDTRECPCDDSCECERKAAIEGALKLLDEVLS